MTLEGEGHVPIVPIGGVALEGRGMFQHSIMCLVMQVVPSLRNLVHSLPSEEALHSTSTTTPRADQ